MTDQINLRRVQLYRSLLETQANNIMDDIFWTYEDLSKVDPELLNAILEADELLSA